MANKTYFKGKKKSTVKSKKYLFAGFDEATQIDNTGYLNALYNPKYFDTTAVSNETIQKNIDQTINTSKQSSADYAADKEANKQSLLNLTARRKQAQEEEKASMRNMAAQTAQQYTAKNVGAITGLATPAVKFGIDLAAKKAAEKTAATAANLITSTAATKAGADVAKTGIQAGISGTNLLYSGLGAAGVVGGEAWKYFSDDKNPYTYKPSEAAGTIGGNTLSWAGTGAGIGTAIMPGLGTLIGAGVGALGGLTVGLVQNRKKKKMAASLESERAEQEADWNAQKAEYDKYLGQRQRVYDYNQRVARTGMTTLAEQSRQNRLMGLTEGQLAGNTNINMTGGGRKYFGKGGVNVPGGQVVPIGQGAVEFVGRKHSQGGIMLDPQTEVEGGETMDKVMMTGGKFNDYFFSDYLKNGGKSFAQHHKELIKRGASQEEIQTLAKKQEAMANRKGEKDRSPNQVAKYGGIKKYQTGEFKETADAVKEGDKWVVRDEQGKILGKSMDKNVAEAMAQNAVIAAATKSAEAASQEDGAPYRKAVGPVETSFEKMLDSETMLDSPITRFIDPKNIINPPYKDLTGPRAIEETVAPEPSVENSPYFQKVMANYKNEMSSNNTPAAKEKAKKIAEEEAKKLYLQFQKAEEDDKKDDKKDAYSKMYSPEQIKTAKILAGIGFGSQMIAPISSIFMKPNLVSAPTPIVPGMIDTAAAKSVAPMISAGKVEAPRLGRVTPETEDIMNRDVANRQFFSNIGDPSSMIAMIASTGKTNEAERKAIADAQRTNVELAGKEGMLKFEASKANVASSLEAQRANQAAINEAQGRYLNVLSKNQEMKNQAYLANLDAKTKTRLANAQLLADKQNRDITAMSTFGTNVAGGVGDFLSYGIEGEKSRMASGDTGVYERNIIPIFGTKDKDGTSTSKTRGVRKKMYGGTNSYTSRLGDLKFKRALKVK